MNAALEQRASLYLLTLLERERRHARSRQRAGLTAADPDKERPARLQRFDSVVEAFRALDAFSSAEADAE